MAEEKGPELPPPEKTEEELLNIADRMLAKLEREYWQVQSQNFTMPPQAAAEGAEEEEEPNHEEYQMLEGDLDEPEQMSGSEEERDEKEEEAGAKTSLPCKEEKDE